jgi:hypothetical protein
MRQPATTPLQAIVAAIPDDRLRPLLIELLQNGALPKVAMPAPAPKAARPAPKPAPAKRSPGRPRGRPSKAAVLARQRERDAALKREKRAAAAEAKKSNTAQTSTAKANGANGAGSRELRREHDRARHAAKAAAIGPAGAAAAAAEAAFAKTLWQHAEKLQPKAPWRAVVREFGINEAVALDAHRIHRLPPGITGAAVARFMELPAG